MRHPDESPRPPKNAGMQHFVDMAGCSLAVISARDATALGHPCPESTAAGRRVMRDQGLLSFKPGIGPLDHGDATLRGHSHALTRAETGLGYDATAELAQYVHLPPAL
jgi:hypothetical protein